jgi:hypothetical protein
MILFGFFWGFGNTPVPSAGATPVKQKKILVSLGKRGRQILADERGLQICSGCWLLDAWIEN